MRQVLASAAVSAMCHVVRITDTLTLREHAALQHTRCACCQAPPASAALVTKRLKRRLHARELLGGGALEAVHGTRYVDDALHTCTQPRPHTRAERWQEQGTAGMSRRCVNGNTRCVSIRALSCWSQLLHDHDWGIPLAMTLHPHCTRTQFSQGEEQGSEGGAP